MESNNHTHTLISCLFQLMVFPPYSFFQTLSWNMEAGEDVVAKVSITTCLVMNALEFLCFMVIFYDMHKEQTEREKKREA